MKIAILSDSHDNIWNLEKALTAVRVAGCECMLHCGDLVAPFVLTQMALAFGGPIHVVEGNNDGDWRLLQQAAAGYPQVTLHGIYAELSMGGSQIALIHYPEPARRIAESGAFDLVCYGHDHQEHEERVGNCLLVNPGEVMGRFGAPSWGIYDCDRHSFTLQAIGDRDAG